MARRRTKSTRESRTQEHTSIEQRDRLRDISNSDEGAISELVSIRLTEAVDTSDLDPKTYALANIAALIATGGDEASYLLYVDAALDAGASADEITGILTAIGPNVGVFKMVAAADPLAVALGVGLSGDGGDGQARDDG